MHLSNSVLRFSGNEMVGTVSVFRDDFLKAMMRDVPTMTALERLALRSAAITEIERYLTLRSAGTAIRFDVDSTASDGTVYFFRFRARMPSAQGWSFTNTVLFREYTDQMNLLRVEQGERSSSYVLTPSRPSIDLLPE